MPNPNFGLKTEVNFFSNVLIIDYLGEISTHLVDSLLSRGCFVYYFGKEPKENYYYLLGKDNFCYLSDLLDLKDRKEIDYVFYFPGSEKSDLDDFSSLPFFSKSRILIALQSKSLISLDLKSYLERENTNFRLVIFDAVYGPRIKSGLMGDLFYSASKEKIINLPESSNKKIYPISADGLVDGLIKIIFSPDSRGRGFFLKNDLFDLGSFTSLIKKNLPEISFNFSLTDNSVEENLDWLEETKINENTEEKIIETIDWFERNSANKEKEEVTKKESILSSISRPVNIEETQESKINFLFPNKESNELAKKKTSAPQKMIFGVFLFVLLLLIFFVGPLFLLGALGTLGIKNLSDAKILIDGGNFIEARNKANFADKYLSFSQKVVSVSGPFYSLIGLEKPISGLEEILSFSKYIGSSIRLSLEATSKGVDLLKTFVEGEDVKWTENLGLIKADVSLAYEQASLAQSLLTGTKKGFEAINKGEYYDKFKQYLPEMREVMAKGQSLLGVISPILGVGERRTYLILFQNNMEIRPTGGFIGSYGLLTLENGKLINFEVFDVYQADGQLKGHVEPPAKLKEYLGEATWYLRDSNWDPKFSVSAKNAQWFLDKEVGISADGTIAITLETIKGILRALKEVDVPSYSEKINADNLFQKAEYYSELGTFPGSTQKKDFLGSLAKAIFEKIKTSEGKDLVNVAGAIFSSLEHKEIQLYFNDQQVESTISLLNWGGDIRGYQGKEDQAGVFADYLFINEANVGIDKANYFVKRNIDHEITLDSQGRIKENLEIVYENQSPSDNWPAGPYKNYLRIYLPKGSKMTSILVSNSESSDLWQPFDLNQLDISEEYGKSSFGVLLNIPIKSKKKILLSYELDGSVDITKRLNSYLLMVQKQSGSYPSTYSLNFNYPPNFIPLRVIPSAIVADQKLIISQTLDKDLIFQIDLAH